MGSHEAMGKQPLEENDAMYKFQQCKTQLNCSIAVLRASKGELRSVENLVMVSTLEANGRWDLATTCKALLCQNAP